MTQHDEADTSGAIASNDGSSKHEPMLIGDAA